MNPENENERFMPSEQAVDTPADPAAEPQAGAEEAPRAGTTDIQAYIGRQLRAVYDDVVQQPIPDRFLALMKQLEEQTPNG